MENVLSDLLLVFASLVSLVGKLQNIQLLVLSSLSLFNRFQTIDLFDGKFTEVKL